MKLVFLMPIAGLIISSCGTTFEVKNINSYKQQKLANTLAMPDRGEMDEKKTLPRVVVLGTNSTNNKLAASSQIDQILTRNIGMDLRMKTQVVSSAKFNPKLESAIKNSQPYQGEIFADYAILGSISELGSHSVYVDDYIDAGEFYLAQGSCENTLSFAGVLDVFKIPSMLKIGSVTFETGEKNTEKLKGKENVRMLKKDDARMEMLSGGLKGNPSKNHKCSFPENSLKQKVDSLTENAIGSYKENLVNTISPTGYILEKRVNGSQVIFKTSLGTAQGVEVDTRVAVLQLKNSDDMSSFEADIDSFKIGEGGISNELGANHSWILVDDQQVSSKIRLGDLVKVQYRTGFLGLYK